MSTCAHIFASHFIFSTTFYFQLLDAIPESQFCLIRYAPGGSITGMLRRFGALPEDTIRVYTLHILLGLDFLHSANIVHRHAAPLVAPTPRSTHLLIIAGTSKVQMFWSTQMDPVNLLISVALEH